MSNNFSTLTNGFFSIFTIVSSLTNCLVSGLYRCRTTRSAGIAWMLCFAHTSSSAIAYIWNSNMWCMDGIYLFRNESHKIQIHDTEKDEIPNFLTLAAARRILCLWQNHQILDIHTMNNKTLSYFINTPLTFLEDFSGLPPGHTSQMPLCSFRLWIVPP